MLPGFDGLEVCRRIQADRPVPVLMLTARDDETDMLVGLGVGADDYLTKPFSMRELVARVHALLRRVERAAARRPTRQDRRRSRLGDLEIDRAERRVRRGGIEVHLTPTEFDLLVHLAGRPAHGADPRAAAGRRLGLGRRIGHPHRRQPHQGAAPQARRRPDPHRARRRLRPGRRPAA